MMSLQEEVFKLKKSLEEKNMVCGLYLDHKVCCSFIDKSY
jgi:hypothetical protein